MLAGHPVTGRISPAARVCLWCPRCILETAPIARVPRTGGRRIHRRKCPSCARRFEFTVVDGVVQPGSTLVREDEEPSSEDRREWAAEDKHDLEKEGGWEDP